MHRRTDIVQKSRQSQFGGTRPAANCLVSLQNEDFAAGVCKCNGSGQSIWPRAYHHCIITARHCCYCMKPFGCDSANPKYLWQVKLISSVTRFTRCSSPFRSVCCQWQCCLISFFCAPPTVNGPAFPIG